jgi:uncharacterized delta-60 repeat protein
VSRPSCPLVGLLLLPMCGPPEPNATVGETESGSAGTGTGTTTTTGPEPTTTGPGPTTGSGSGSMTTGGESTTTGGESTTTGGASTTGSESTVGLESTTSSESTTVEPSTTGPGPVCGDGAVEGREECDDGSQNDDHNACKADCTDNVCGDGSRGPGEDCDDGNTVDGDGCTPDCGLATCDETALDPGFGGDGFVQIATTGQPGGMSSDLDRDYGTAIALAPDGDIVFGGERYDGSSYNFALVRLQADGALDPGFGTGGVLTDHGFPGPSRIRGVAVDSAGNVVVAVAVGNTGMYGLARLTGQGDPDPTFGGTGFIVTGVAHPAAESVAAFQPIGLQSDDRVILGGGDGDFVVARFTGDGQLDASFGAGGTATVVVSPGHDAINSLRVMPDDTIVATGVGDRNGQPWNVGEFAVAVLDADGAPDLAFNGTGSATAAVHVAGGRPHGVTRQLDGKVVAIGCTLCDYNFMSEVDTAVVRFLATGGLDAAFGVGGVRTLELDPFIDIGFDIVATTDRLVIAGGAAIQQQVGKMYVARLLQLDGSLDPCFGVGGVFKAYPTQGFAGNDQAFSLQILDDGDILAAGSTGSSSWGDFAVMKIVP